MFNPTLCERIVHKIYRISLPVFAPFNRRQLSNTDFTIISNNCWGGICYEHYGLKKQSPTIGAYFFADDYIKFISDLRYYLGQELKFIRSQDSKYVKQLTARNEENVLIGLLGDVEIVFLHYDSQEVIKEKWQRRVSRINWDNLIFKFSYQNECTEEHIHKFFNLELPGKRFAFVNRRYEEYPFAYMIDGYENQQIDNDAFFWNKYFDVTAYLNER